MLFEFARWLRRVVRAVYARRKMFKILGYFALAGVLWKYGNLAISTSVASSVAVYLLAGGWKYWRIVIKTFPRDYRAGKFLLKAKKLMSEHEKNHENVVTLFNKTVKKHPDKIALIMVDGKEWTFREVDEYSNAFANYLLSQGYKKGDVVALFLDNRPEFACLWLGMAKIGVIGALINYNLKSDSLCHCVKAAEAKSVIYGDEFGPALQEIEQRLPTDMTFYCLGKPDSSVMKSVHLDPLIQQSSTAAPPTPTINFNEKLFYIYTSGTTGLPKAAIVIHSRFFYMSFSTHSLFNLTGDDVVYDTLPLYHTAGGILGIGQMLLMGCTVVVRKKFSASRFWDDCIKYNCTAMQYIGEICRYLLAQPPKPTDRMHRVRCAYGNGLRPQIWTQFTQRFGITWVGEFYGATEGNANILNPDNTVGAVGFCTQIAPSVYPITLMKVNEETGELLRDADGMCIKCKPGESGEMVGKIIKGDPLREFDGYVNKEATSKKLATNVFTKGDSAFLTGDILDMDELGYLYFRDRTGDTFRWKGENVSTTEVEARISNTLKLNDCVAYGVEVPGVEGRAGMAAIVDEDTTLHLQQLAHDLRTALPVYARPVFIRVLDKLEMTGTFKLKKVDYRKDGFDPSKVKKDKLYYMDSKSGEYQPIDAQVFQDIKSGKIRF